MVDLGIIGFENFKIDCIIGIEPHERINEQEIVIDLKVEADMSKVSASDSIYDAIDYVQLAKICEETAKGKYNLLEKYAADVLKVIFNTFKVSSASIRVMKPEALPGAAQAFIELYRKAPGATIQNF